MENLLLPSENLLPFDGLVHYHGAVMDQKTATRYMERLLGEIAWEHDELLMFGKRITTKRKVAWYGTRPFEYTYSRVTRKALPWTPLLNELKHIAEVESGESYNSCLLNLYHHGEEGMGWHSDNEKELLKGAAIASMSFGAVRKFAFKHRDTKETVSLYLDPGSLLIMKGVTQEHWVHRLPPSKRISQPRINLTFRTIA
ncbi:alpha-ketoglutarate-dependent dioxygenase AlkB family protein [Zeaxanthinibacter enoshimensis]|uniref:Alkylated DNA repair dioxygenase AlkB n=1 Tax=Zeaxanthinibacter enoshimensis TaxID=392009 RepID=A0A4R6TMR2_9FLAO|nr:alpha-ketoglutarate-dependent dioxygenase AlkB [Zeaxanthinibacter enoshimensis]TDQ30955.1 alkylated DNA repair dioxygenase AlkB [Zeaxanthinibacter enoshimensis]